MKIFLIGQHSSKFRYYLKENGYHPIFLPNYPVEPGRHLLGLGIGLTIFLSDGPFFVWPASLHVLDISLVKLLLQSSAFSYCLGPVPWIACFLCQSAKTVRHPLDLWPRKKKIYKSDGICQIKKITNAVPFVKFRWHLFCLWLRHKLASRSLQ